MTAESQLQLDDQARHVGDMLFDLARGLPPGVLRELDALTESHRRDSDAGPAS